MKLWIGGGFLGLPRTAVLGSSAVSQNPFISATSQVEPGSETSLGPLDLDSPVHG